MGLMLDLLRLLEGGAMLTVEEAAARLEVDPAVVSLMLRRLTAEGYLRSAPPSCTVAPACESCPLRRSCALKPERPMWALTAEGRAALRRGSEESR